MKHLIVLLVASGFGFQQGLSQESHQGSEKIVVAAKEISAGDSTARTVATLPEGAKREEAKQEMPARPQASLPDPVAIQDQVSGTVPH